MSRPRTLFFGTPEIAVPSLVALHEISDVCAVVCQPDKPRGRGLHEAAPPVKERALALGLPVHQPSKVRTPEFAEWVAAQRAEVAIVIAYGRILPGAVLAGPRLGMLNLHASLLPKYRGAAPITWAVVDGETETGISLMQMDQGMDTGPVFSRHTLPIGPDMTAGELSVALAELAARVVRSELPRVLAGEVVATAQDHAHATLARMLQKEDGRIDWTKPAPKVHDHVRGMSPWPGAFTTLGGKLFKVLETRRVTATTSAAPGTITMAHRGRIEIACGEGLVELVRGQLEGKKALPAQDLVGGRTLSPGMVLGERP